MPDPGYLVSKAALDRFNAAASAVRNRLAPPRPAYLGQPERQRFLMKVTGKYAGGGIYSALADVAYEGYAVVQDGDAGDFVAVSGGPTWGGSSGDWPPVVDILAVNYSKHADPSAIEIVAGSVVEVFQLGNDEFSACWYCYGDDYVNDTYNYDSQAFYDSGHPETAYGDDGWDIDDQVDTSGVTVTVQTGTVYNYLGDKVLYAFLRTLTFDALGRLTAVSPERRQTVDPAGPC